MKSRNGQKSSRLPVSSRNEGIPVSRPTGLSAKEEAMALTIKHTSAPLGHELVGVDLKTVDEPTFRELDEAYKKYGVIVVRGQNLSPRELIDFSGRFGKLLVYP